MRDLFKSLFLALTAGVLFGFTACVTDAGGKKDEGGSGNGGSSSTPPASVTSVVLNETSAKLIVGLSGYSTVQLTATVTGTNLTDADKGVTWTSSNESAATVSSTGLVTAVAAGNAVITATSTKDTTKKATCSVTVTSSSSSEILWRADDYLAQTCTDNQTLGIMTVIVGGGSVTIDENEKSIDEYSFTKRLKFGGSGSTTKNTIKFTTSASANVTIYYMSGKSATERTLLLTNSTGTTVASGINNGDAIGSFTTDSAIDAGTYYIYSAGSGINVYGVKIVYENASSIVPPIGVTLNKTTLEFDLAGDTVTETLTATLAPADVTSGLDGVEWSSSDVSVATVSSSGLVTAKKAGNAVITVTTECGSFTATCSVTVTGANSADLIVVPGASVTTNGWADMANSGSGMSYPNTTNIIYIGDDGYKVGSGSLTSYTSSLTKRKVFTNAIASGSVSSSSLANTAAIVVVSGSVDLGDGVITDDDKSYYDEFNESTHARSHGDITYEIGSNKAIIGVNGAKLMFGGLLIKASSGNSGKAGENVIIQNVEFWDAHGSTEYDTSVSGTYTSGTKTYKYSDSKASIDALVLEASGASSGSYSYIPKNVWIDHCKFSDGTCEDLTRNYNHDGSLDIKGGKYVTISYCEFTNHDKVTLLAPGETYTPSDERQITFHHNYYHSATQRMPRSRGCQVHIYNNYYNGIYQYSIGPGINSQYIVENCYFGTHSNSSSIVKYYDCSASADADTFSKIYASGNYPTLSDSNTTIDTSVEKNTGATSSNAWTVHSVSTKPWTINYEYTLDAASDLPSLIPDAAGVDKEGYTVNVKVNGVAYY